MSCCNIMQLNIIAKKRALKVVLPIDSRLKYYVVYCKTHPIDETANVQSYCPETQPNFKMLFYIAIYKLYMAISLMTGNFHGNFSSTSKSNPCNIAGQY